jgi:hypothetical protein
MGVKWGSVRYGYRPNSSRLEIRLRQNVRPMSETRSAGISVGAVRSTLIGYGVLAFTFFPPTRTLMLWGVGVQIAVIVARKLIERQVRDPAMARQALLLLELLGDGATVALFAIATLGGIMQFEQQI